MIKEQLIKIYDTLDDDQKKLHDSLFNIYKDGSVMDQSIQESKHSRKFKNFILPQRSENLQLDTLIQTNNKLQSQNEELMKQQQQQIQNDKGQNKQENANQISDVKVMSTMFQEMIKPFINEIQELKTDLKNIQNQKRKNEFEIEVQRNKIYQQSYQQDKIHKKIKIEKEQNHQQIIEQNYQIAVNDINDKMKQIQKKLQDFSNFDRQVIQLQNDQDQQLLSVIKNNIQDKINFNLPLNELEKFDYKKFQSDNNKILAQIREYRESYINQLEDQKQYIDFDKLIQKIKKEKKSKKVKEKSLIDLYKKKFGKKYEQFIQNRKPILKINFKTNNKLVNNQTNFQIKKNLQKIQSKPQDCIEEIEFKKVNVNNSVIFYNPDEELKQLQQEIKNHENDFLKTIKVDKEVIQQNIDNQKLLKKQKFNEDVIEDYIKQQGQQKINKTEKKQKSKKIEFNISKSNNKKKYCASKIFDLNKSQINSIHSDNINNITHISIQQPQSLLLEYDDIKNVQIKKISLKYNQILILMQVEQRQLQEPKKHDLDTIEQVNNKDEKNEQKKDEEQPVEIKRYRNPFNIFMLENKDKFKNLGSNYLKEVSELWKLLSDTDKQYYIQKSNQEKQEYYELVKKYGLPQKKFKKLKNSDFSISKLKSILSDDPSLDNKFSEKGLQFMCLATEKFLENLIDDTYALSKKKNQKKLKEDIFLDLRKSNINYDFLKDLTIYRVQQKTRSNKKNKEEKEEVIIDKNPITNYFQIIVIKFKCKMIVNIYN